MKLSLVHFRCSILYKPCKVLKSLFQGLEVTSDRKAKVRSIGFISSNVWLAEDIIIRVTSYTTKLCNYEVSTLPLIYLLWLAVDTN